LNTTIFLPYPRRLEATLPDARKTSRLTAGGGFLTRFLVSIIGLQGVIVDPRAGGTIGPALSSIEGLASTGRAAKS
jgi:hypothetical protein